MSRSGVEMGIVLPCALQDGRRIGPSDTVAGLDRPPDRPSRARHSSRPSTANTSKIPGEVVRPVSATRSGCATAPSLRLFASAKVRIAASVVSAVQAVTASSAARSRPISARFSGVSSAAAFGSISSGRSAKMK